jgi:hypothetical protein
MYCPSLVGKQDRQGMGVDSLGNYRRICCGCIEKLTKGINPQTGERL